MSTYHSRDLTQVQVVFQVVPLPATQTAGRLTMADVFLSAVEENIPARDVYIMSESTLAYDKHTFEPVVVETLTFRGFVALRGIVWQNVLRAIALALKPNCEYILPRVHVYVVAGEELEGLPGYGKVLADPGCVQSNIFADGQSRKSGKPAISLALIDRGVA